MDIHCTHQWFPILRYSILKNHIYCLYICKMCSLNHQFIILNIFGFHIGFLMWIICPFVWCGFFCVTQRSFQTGFHGTVVLTPFQKSWKNKNSHWLILKFNVYDYSAKDAADRPRRILRTKCIRIDTTLKPLAKWKLR